MEYLVDIFGAATSALLVSSILLCSFFLTIHFGSRAINMYAGKIDHEKFLIIEANQTIICLLHALVFFKIVFFNESLWWLALIPFVNTVCYSIYKLITKETNTINHQVSKT